jgi:hypothetical protein
MNTYPQLQGSELLFYLAVPPLHHHCYLCLTLLSVTKEIPTIRPYLKCYMDVQGHLCLETMHNYKGHSLKTGSTAALLLNVFDYIADVKGAIVIHYSDP